MQINGSFPLAKSPTPAAGNNNSSTKSPTTSPISPELPASTAKPPLIGIDIDGDGKPDILVSPKPGMGIDIDGDGKVDIVFPSTPKVPPGNAKGTTPDPTVPSDNALKELEKAITPDPIVPPGISELEQHLLKELEKGI